jgi:hypothetical protein
MFGGLEELPITRLLKSVLNADALYVFPLQYVWENDVNDGVV